MATVDLRIVAYGKLARLALKMLDAPRRIEVPIQDLANMARMHETMAAKLAKVSEIVRHMDPFDHGLVTEERLAEVMAVLDAE